MFYKKGFRPRQFEYKPWFYDPVKEEFESRVSEAKAHYHGEKENYKLKGSFNFRQPARTPSTRDRRFDMSYGRINTTRIIALAALLGGLVYLLFTL